MGKKNAFSPCSCYSSMSRPGWLPPTNEELKDDGPSSPDNTHRKIAVKDALRNKYSIYIPFPPTTRYAEQRAPRNLPFSLSSIGENRKPRSSNVASKLAAYRYDSTSPEPQQQTNDDPRSTTPTRQLRERKAKQFKLEPSSEEEEEEEDVAAGHQNLGRKRRRLNRSLDSDDEDDPMDYDDGDSAYVDEKELKAKMQDKMTPDVDRTMILERLFPHVSHERILEVLDMAGGSQVRASQILSGQKKPESMSPSTSPVAPRHKLTRLRRGRRDASSDDDDDDEEEISYKDHRKNIEETRKMIQTVRFYNKATSQEIQDVTGCTPEQAEKLSKRRPFADIDQLREVLQQEKGLSVKFISAYVDMMDGYTVVDQIIEQIEDLGTELKQIIDVWKGSQGTPTPSGGSPSSSDVDELEEDVGTHLADMRVKEDIDTNSEIYRDAMNGFLTEQPEIISKDVKLKDYQLLGINWLLMLYRKGISGILADEMGLGKTAQVISFLGRLYEIGNRGPHLIIVPTSTLDNWLREFERFCPTLKVCAYYGTQDERMEMREHLLEDRDNYQVFVTTYTVATGSKDDRSFLRKLRCQSMILDEGHMVRNCTSARYQHLISLRTPFRLLLTGTPLQNNLQELVSLLMFILPDMLVEYEEEVRKIFKIKSVTTTVTSSASKSKKTHHPPSSAQILSRQRIARAKKMMTPFVLRRRKADVLKDLPKKIQVIEKCAMTKNQQALYDAILQESKQSYKEALDTTTSTRSSTKKREREGFEKFKNIVSQLRKAADHPLLFRNVYTNETLKKMAKSIMKVCVNFPVTLLLNNDYLLSNRKSNIGIPTKSIYTK